MAKVRDGEVERSSNGDKRDGEVELQASRGARSEHHAPAFEVHLSAPWEVPRSAPPGTPTLLGSQCVRLRGPTPAHEVTRVVEERSRVHEAWIHEIERTKRLALVIGAVLFLAGCQVIVFAPSGRETVAAIVGAAMLVVAAGTAGYRRVWGRTLLVSIGAGDAELADENSVARIKRAKPLRRGAVR